MKKELTALKPLFILLPLLVLGFLLFWTLFGGTLSKDFQFKSAPSEQFTQEEIQDAADVVLMKRRLLDVPAAIRLSRATLRNIHENLFWAFFYNVIGIPLAAGAWIHLLGWEMNPMFGAAAMSLSSFCVVTNALRLNLFRIRSTKHDHKRKNHAKQTVAKTAEDHKENKEETSMEKTMKIEGMMCGHCEARVKKCLEARPGGEKAEGSHVSGTAVLTLSAPVEDALLKKTVEDQGYQVF